jgi:hypothetical protein
MSGSPDSASPAKPASYVAAVLAHYLELPDSLMRASLADHRLARSLFDRGLPLPLVESALLLATLRRLVRPTDLPPLQPIRSLAYFLPVIEELLANPLPDGYVDYLRLKLSRCAKVNSSAIVQKPTVSKFR